MKTLRKTAIIALVILSCTACFKNTGSSISWTAEFTGTITSVNAQTSDRYEESKIKSVIDMDDATASILDFTLNDFKLSLPMNTIKSMTMPNLRFSVTDGTEEGIPVGSWKISVSELTPLINDVQDETYKVRNLNGIISDYYIKFTFELETSGQKYNVTYSVTQSWNKNIVGDFTTSDAEGNSIYVDEAVKSTVYLGDVLEKSFDLKISGVQFVQNMPLMNIDLPGIPFTSDASDSEPLSGTWNILPCTIVPTIGGVAYEQYTMTNFQGTIDENDFEFSFNIQYDGQTYTVTYSNENY